MRAGRLNARITIEQPTDTQNAVGDTVQTWAVLDTVAAEYVPLRGQEAVVADAMQASITCKFRIRWRDDVTAIMRIKWDGRIYNIKGPPIPLGRRETLELMAEAVGP